MTSYNMLFLFDSIKIFPVFYKSKCYFNASKNVNITTNKNICILVLICCNRRSNGCKWAQIKTSEMSEKKHDKQIEISSVCSHMLLHPHRVWLCFLRRTDLTCVVWVSFEIFFCCFVVVLSFFPFNVQTGMRNLTGSPETRFF